MEDGPLFAHDQVIVLSDATVNVVDTAERVLEADWEAAWRWIAENRRKH